ncbi:MAG: pilus assembly protein [Anaerolineae bacterium]|nr:pilus assembly protein [Anaerolineae bacterium]
MNRILFKTSDRKLMLKHRGNRAQGMLEFSLALPIMVMLLFGIIEFALVFQAWLSIENIARQTVRYAVTGQYEHKYCSTENGWNWNSDSDDSEICKGDNANEEQERARLLSIQAMANSQKVALFDEPDLEQDEIGYINIVVCSDRNDDDEGPDYNYTKPSGSTYSSCTDSGSPIEDAGAPGDQVYIAVDFNHPFLTPVLNKVWPMMHLRSYREGRVETFNAQKIGLIPDTGSEDLPESPAPDPVLEGTACDGIVVEGDWKTKKKDLKIKIKNNTGFDVYLDHAILDWSDHQIYMEELELDQSVKELKFDKTKIFTGDGTPEDDGLESPTPSDTLQHVKLQKNKTKEFKAKFQTDIEKAGTTNFNVILYFEHGCVLSLEAPDPDVDPTIPEVTVGPEGEIFYIGVEDPSAFLHVVWHTNEDGSVTVLATFSTTFNDNTYNYNDAPNHKHTSWGAKTHTFNKLEHSDHLRFDMKDANGITFFDAKVDYLYEDETTDPFTYYTGGVTKGDSKIYSGNDGMVKDVKTSLDENLKLPDCNQAILLLNSPKIYDNYVQDPNDPTYCPDWDFSVWFEITIDASAIPDEGFGYPSIASIHASPAKTSSSTLEVQPGADPSLPPYFDN